MTDCLKYSQEAEMFSEYNDEWDFQYDKLEEGEQDKVMSISYSSNQNTTCNLKLQWWEERDPWSREVEADAYIDNKTESIEVLERTATE